MTEQPETIAHWLPIYMERFGDTITFDMFPTEADAVAAIREALIYGKPIPEPDPGIII